MNTTSSTGNQEDFNETNPGQTLSDEEKKLADDEALKKAEEENTGMDMGVDFEVDKEQDLDDLVHSQGSLRKNDIPPPEEA